MLKRGFRTRSCHSERVQEFWVLLSARAGISPFAPRVTASAPRESATRKTTVLPFVFSYSVVTVARSRVSRCSKPAMNSVRYCVWNAWSAMTASYSMVHVTNLRTGCPPRLRFHIAGLVYILGKWCVKPLPLAPRCQLLLGGGEFAEPRLQLLGFLALPVFRV